jgi:hypothetical protein
LRQTGEADTHDPAIHDGFLLALSRRLPKRFHGRAVRRGRTWTHITIEARSRRAHAVEFSKTAKPPTDTAHGSQN